ncbi:hypothetical protein ACOMHN_056511 [Nucella lapillus]
MYNVRWSGDAPDWDGPLSAIFESQTKRFKINASHSFILHHREENRYRFFHASQNNNAGLFDRPRLINDRHDFDRFLEDLHAEDALEYARQKRPDSKWTVQSICTTSFYLNPLPDFPIGGCEGPFPDYITKNQYIVLLNIDGKKPGNPTETISASSDASLCTSAAVERLKSCSDVGNRTEKKKEAFPGVVMDDLGELERLFGVNINVFRFDEDE